jgi:prephenate dehydrogenase
MLFRHIAIVGVGLIGGSFALAARRSRVAERITGVDSADVLGEACARGIIDEPEKSFESGQFCEADLIYLAAPVGGILSFLRTRAKLLKPGAIVTDAGSTKREISRVARETLPAGVYFVGGHPMAGSHNAGMDYADGELFRNAPYALVIDDFTPESTLQMVEKLVSAIGAVPVNVTAEEHDRTVARMSHVPQLVATALACTAARHSNQDDLRLAGTGFSEMVRLGGSRWSVWKDICRTNGDEICLALDDVISELEAVRSSISSGDFEGLGDAFETANGLVKTDALRSNRKIS